MAVSVRIRDESPTGTALGDAMFELPERLTARELIRHRVREEVARYNASESSTFHGLVQPTDAEATLNGYRMRAPRSVHWEKQAEIALQGFKTNAFFVLVGNRQVEDLDDEVDVEAASDVAFVRLVPLIGG